MRQSVYYLFIIFTIVLQLPLPSFAQVQSVPRINIVIKDALVLPDGDLREQVRDANGNLLIKPGDQIEYTLIATNLGTAPAQNVEMIDPIPDGTEYVKDSATGDNMIISYSIDGGNTYLNTSPTYTVQLSNGQTETVIATPAMYTHIKWLITEAIPPGASKKATLRVKVKSNP